MNLSLREDCLMDKHCCRGSLLQLGHGYKGRQKILVSHSINGWCLHELVYPTSCVRINGNGRPLHGQLDIDLLLAAG